jgi:hypothetical protein
MRWMTTPSTEPLPTLSGSKSVNANQTDSSTKLPHWPPEVLDAWRRARLDRQSRLDAWALENARSTLARKTVRPGYEPWEVAAAWDDAREELRRYGYLSILEQDLEDERWERISHRGLELFVGAVLGALGTGALMFVSEIITGGTLPEAAAWLVLGLGTVIGAVVAYVLHA